MGNFALYQALSGTDNWQQKRQDKMANLMMMDKMAQKSQKDLQAQMEFEEGIQEQLDAVSQFDVLPEDQEAVNEAEAQARMGIIKGITKFNGDLKRYMASGGISDLGDYKRSILNSSAVKNAAHNKAQYAQYIDAKQKDMFIGRAEVDVPVMENGAPKLDKDGNIVTKKKRLTMEQQMALKKRGMLDRIAVGNIEKKAQIDANYFKKNYKDATKPWAADNVVTETDVYENLTMRGISDEQARAIANQYGSEVAGSPERAMKWNAMNPMELASMKADMEYKLAQAKKASMGSKGSKKQRVLNDWKTGFERIRTTQGGIGTMMPTRGANADPNASGRAEILSASESDYLKKYWKNKKPSAYDAHYGAFDEDDRADGMGMYDLGNADVEPLEKVIKYNPQGEPQSFIKARVFYQDGFEPDNFEITDGNRNNFRETTRRVKVKDKDENLGYRIEEFDGYEGFVLIGVDEEERSLNFGTDMAADIGWKDNINYAQPGATYENMQASSYETKMGIIRNLVEQNNMTWQQAENFYNENIGR